jgi:methionine-rich copper-binding protein CopC
MRIRRALGMSLAGGAALVLALGAPLSASAHDSLSSSTPAAEATVTDPLSQVDLTFAGVLLDFGEGQRSTAIQVRQGDRYFETGCARISEKTASAPVALGAAGTYEVVWQVVSSDGHPTSGSYSFTYSPSVGTEASAGAAKPACAPLAGASAGGPGDDAILLGAAACIGMLTLAGVAAAVIVGRRRARVPTA